jgi:hypothetical protein
MEPVLGDAEFRERADAIKQTLAEAVVAAQ